MTESFLTLEVLGVEGLLFAAESIRSLTVRLVDGSLIGIRPGHAPLTGMTAPGPVRYQLEERWNQTETTAGILTIRNNTVRIMTIGTDEENKP